jgi:hypothetical protein
LQFGEVQWWYFAAASGMPFYDAYTTSTFQAQYGTAMSGNLEPECRPLTLTQECVFLPSLIGQFTSAIRQFVRQTYPTTQFEVLYPHDVNNTALNRIINYPLSDWTPSNLACLKTENFTYTGDRNLDEARQSIQFPAQNGFPPAQASHSDWNQRLHDSLGEGAFTRYRSRGRVGGSVRSRSVLPDRLWPAVE